MEIKQCFLLALFVWAFEYSEGFDSKIVNGSMALPGEFPFMVSLRHASSGRHSCGASLLNRVWVLTAAHCVVKSNPKQINIQYGSIELDQNSTDLANVSKIFVHEGYNPANQYIHDIALLRLEKPATVEKDFVGVRLPELNASTDNQTPVTLIGWGLNATGGVVQQLLQKVDLEIFDDDECSKRHGVQMHSTTICAGVPEGGKGQCSGDSGGPLLLNGTQVGIVSWSRKPCTRPPYPGVFTEVSAYVGWILETILDAEDDEEDNTEGLEQILSGNLIIVSLRLKKSKKHFCAGTIIKNNLILTAAHCFTYVKKAEEFLIQYNSTLLNPIQPQYAVALDIIKHEGYNPTIAIHDIALVRLKESISLSTNLYKVKLADDYNASFENITGTLVGWGLNETNGALAVELEKVNLEIVALEECRNQLKSIIHISNLCAGGVENGQCSGDSGGPLLYANRQIGIVSWSFKPCASKPGIFTNLSYYTQWIQEKVVSIDTLN
ncbi:serine protease 46 isoform X1 [Lucilia cuprina]|uniref:serine protease 46 isoform X1 n=1 Tax=Lucilia cuprina TaxID=7375 RepID=UPI001F067E76|nr:serine protease 46 isoform X1 [Lucilia cuprina]XP_046802006.1 serine protease 46 isoform X1 [Lucilia cuprina]